MARQVKVCQVRVCCWVRSIVSENPCANAPARGPQGSAGGPQDARETLAGTRHAFGSVPNMLGTMASAPAQLKAYLTVPRLMAAHTAIAAMQGVPPDVVLAVRDGRAIANPKPKALRVFTRAVVARRGHPTASERQAFLAAGYADHQMLDVGLGVGMKTLSNFTNHIADTALDEAFAEVAWAATA